MPELALKTESPKILVESSFSGRVFLRHGYTHDGVDTNYVYYKHPAGHWGKIMRHNGDWYHKAKGHPQQFGSHPASLEKLLKSIHVQAALIKSDGIHASLAKGNNRYSSKVEASTHSVLENYGYKHTGDYHTHPEGHYVHKHLESWIHTNANTGRKSRGQDSSSLKQHLQKIHGVKASADSSEMSKIIQASRGPDIRTKHGQNWIHTFKSTIKRHYPEHQGKIDWNAASEYYNQGNNPEFTAHHMYKKEFHKMSAHGTPEASFKGNKSMPALAVKNLPTEEVKARQNFSDEKIQVERKHLNDLVDYHHHLEGKHTVAALKHEEMAEKKPAQERFHKKMMHFHQAQALHHFHSKAAVLRHLHHLD